MTNATMNLSEAIKAVAPHVGRDKSLPVLTNVRIVNGTVSATDRYTLALVTLAPAELDPRIDVLLSPDDVKQGIVSITPNETGVPTLTFANGSTKPATVPLPEETGYSGEFPDLQKLSDSMSAKITEDNTDRIDAFAVNLDYLARFHGKHVASAANRRSKPTPIFTLGADATKPIRATYSDFPEYVGFIVPIRVSAV